MSVAIEQESGIMTALLEGEIDHHTARTIRESIDERVEKIKPETLRLDFKKVTFMDSSGIGLVMGRYKLMKMIGGTLQVVNISGNIKKIMKMAGLEGLGVLGGEVKKNEAD